MYEQQLKRFDVGTQLIRRSVLNAFRRTWRYGLDTPVKDVTPAQLDVRLAGHKGSPGTGLSLRAKKAMRLKKHNDFVRHAGPKARTLTDNEREKLLIKLKAEAGGRRQATGDKADSVQSGLPRACYGSAIQFAAPRILRPRDSVLALVATRALLLAQLLKPLICTFIAWFPARASMLAANPFALKRPASWSICLTWKPPSVTTCVV